MSTAAPTPATPPTALVDLAAECGVDAGYTDGQGVRHDASEATLRAVLAALDVDAGTTDDDAAAALERIRLRPWRRVLPPTVVARVGGAPWIHVHVPDGASLRVEVELEEGGTRPLRQVPVWTEPTIVDGVTTGRATVELPSDLPAGWHRLVAVVDDVDPRHDGSDLRAAGGDPDRGTCADRGGSVATLLVAPTSIPLPGDLGDRRAVGLAVQLYQVRSRASWGVGDLADLADLADWSARDLGADYVLVNPMHAAEPEPPVEPSPYLPTSRRFASPLYLRIEDIDEYAYLDAAGRERISRLAESARTATDADTIDRDTCWAAKLGALRLLYAAGPSGRRLARFEEFLQREGEGLHRFAVWCSLATRHGSSWYDWPAELQDPSSPEVAEYAAEHADDVRFHEWMQWLVAEQRADTQRDALRAGMRLGIVHDLAVGVHPGGADAWALTHSLARGVSVGAPPDMYNQRGQDWSQPPLRPDALAEDGYAAFRDLVRGALRDAGGVRIDHILGLFRLWWIPHGLAPTEGTYVNYDAEALFGVLALEATRAGAVVVGEDLGTVAPGVRELMTERGVFGTSITWFEQQEDGRPVPAESYRRLCMSSVTTHDLPPTAGYVDLVQVELRERLGQLVSDPAEERARAAGEIDRFAAELRDRGLLGDDPGTPELVDALHAFLGRTPSLILSVAVADIAGDRRPVNVPGTYREYPNWCVPLAGPDGVPILLEDLRTSAVPRRIMGALTR